jgi:hypothetical protein
LLIRIMGTSDSVTVDNWYGSSTAKLGDFRLADNSVLDSSLAQLVQAMATYSASNPGFDPTATSQAPSDTTLQNAITSSWH